MGELPFQDAFFSRNEETLRVLEAYSRGINAGRAGGSRRPPSPATVVGTPDALVRPGKHRGALARAVKVKANDFAGWTNSFCGKKYIDSSPGT